MSAATNDDLEVHFERISAYACVLRQLAMHDVVPDDLRQSVHLSMVHAIERSVDEARASAGTDAGGAS